MSKTTKTNQPPASRRMGKGPGRMNGMGVPEKAKNFKKSWGKLLKYCRVFLPVIIIALVAAAISAVLLILGPDWIKKLTNEITKNIPIYKDNVLIKPAFPINMDTVKTIAAVLICFYSVSLILGIIDNWILNSVSQKISKQMRSDISSKINRLPLGYFKDTSYGDVLSRVTNDVDTIGQTLSQSIGTLVTAAIMFIGSLTMMFITNWIMALTAVGASLIGFIIMMFIMMSSQKFFITQQKELGEINGLIEENYTGHNVIKVYNASSQSEKKFSEINHKLYTSAWKAQFFSGLMMPLMLFIGNFGYVAVCVVGAVLAIKGIISFGVIVAFMIYIRLFTQPLSQFAQAFNSLQSTAAAGERVFEFLEETELENESHKTARLTNVKGEIEFKNVSFGYTEDKIVIKDFSVRAKAGQKIAIVGPTGAGKTTIVNLLMRFYELNSGQILLDGTPINEVPRENVHDQFCMVLQDSWLFEGTIKENIKYSKPDVTDEQVIEACKTAGIHHIIQTLPDGYDTVLNDRASLSEGEKQLLTIARAIIKNSPLLILDEATSSVDTRTERIVQTAMDKLTKNRTSFVIAHRLSTIKNADLILVMKRGSIVESGTHTQLLEQNGFYAELYNAQFEDA